MATTEEIAAIAKALNGVQSAGQARAASGAALNAANAAYKILPRLSSDRALAGQHELDNVRLALESAYRTIKDQAAQAPVKEWWATNRKLIEKVYVTIGGIEGTANYTPQTSNLEILGQSIREAPGVFGAAAGQVVKEAGGVVGNAAGGILSGLGVSGTITLAIVIGVILLVVTRGSILRMFTGGGGG